MKNKRHFGWGIKIILCVFLFSILMFPISSSISLDSEGKLLHDVETTDNIQPLLQIESELPADTINGIAAAASTTSAVITPVELY